MNALIKREFHSQTSKDYREIILLDTFLGSENAGDQVIMEACEKVCDELWPKASFTHLPTHYYSANSENKRDVLKILCGTNIIYQRMEDQSQWSLPNNLSSYNNICLLGVGMSDIGINEKASLYSRLFMKSVLSQEYIHSVRDGLTKKRLEEMGVSNVVNTACPTMWCLAPELQRNIPQNKQRKCITSITDYCFDEKQDKRMLEILNQEYEEVIIWVQGSHDIDWCLEKIVNLNDYRVIGPNLSELDQYLESEEADYIGTRLHAGIRSLSKKHRSLIIAVDNRARQIGKDTNLPVMERGQIDEKLSAWINTPSVFDIVLPWENISLWKDQFKDVRLCI